MPQLHLYVPAETAQAIKREADRRGLSVSRYLAKLVQKEVATDWPPGYFDHVVGGWQGDLTRPEPGVLEEREQF